MDGVETIMVQFKCDCGNVSFHIHYTEDGELMEVICFNCNKHHPTKMEAITKTTEDYVKASMTLSLAKDTVIKGINDTLIKDLPQPRNDKETKKYLRKAQKLIDKNPKFYEELEKLD